MGQNRGLDGVWQDNDGQNDTDSHRNGVLCRNWGVVAVLTREGGVLAGMGSMLTEDNPLFTHTISTGPASHQPDHSVHKGDYQIEGDYKKDHKEEYRFIASHTGVMVVE